MTIAVLKPAPVEAHDAVTIGATSPMHFTMIAPESLERARTWGAFRDEFTELIRRAFASTVLQRSQQSQSTVPNNVGIGSYASLPFTLRSYSEILPVSLWLCA
jgi:hypothetical protein